MFGIEIKCNLQGALSKKSSIEKKLFYDYDSTSLLSVLRQRRLKCNYIYTPMTRAVATSQVSMIMIIFTESCSHKIMHNSSKMSGHDLVNKMFNS